ncbi:hypothetical protein J6Z39_07405 [bacterium]|nr:hypothetical protein [bacterium]
MDHGVVIFSEKQGFFKVGVITIIGVLILLTVIFITVPGAAGKFNSSDPGALITMVIAFCIMIILFLVMKLETLVCEEGIYVRFFPFQIKFLFFDWNRLAKCHVRKFRPIVEFGGWGIKGRSKNNYSLTVSGNQGLQLETTDGKRLLIGTQCPEELMSTLNAMNKVMQ